jgi:hypothetical protein
VFSRVRLSTPLGANQSLYFSVRSILDTVMVPGWPIPLDKTFLEASGAFIVSGGARKSFSWKNDKILNEWTTVEIPIPFPYVDSLMLWFTGGAENGPTDGCHFRSFSWVDGIEIKPSSTAALSEISLEPHVLVFPNPADETVHFSGLDGQKWKKIEVFDLSGRKLIEVPNENSLNIRDLFRGMYVVRLYHDHGSFSRKIVKR